MKFKYEEGSKRAWVPVVGNSSSSIETVLRFRDHLVLSFRGSQLIY